MHNTPPIIIPIPHENRYVTVAYKKSTAREDTWSLVRELLTDHINAINKTPDNRNVRFNEKIKTFTYNNKDSDDELEMFTNEDFDTDTDNMTVKYDSDDQTRNILKQPKTNCKDETVRNTMTKPETKRKAINRNRNKILTRDSDTETDDD